MTVTFRFYYNHLMRKLLLLSIFFCACAPSPAQTTDVSLAPYLTATPAASSTPNVLTIIETAQPTSTQQVYMIESGDTISEIAEKFRIPQAALIAANPDVNPNTLTIGQTLFIPDPSAALAAASTPTPLPIPITQAACHPTTDSGLWCFVLVQNTTPDILENVSVQINLFDENDQVIASQVAFLPLDMLSPNTSLPVFVFFPNMPATAKPQAQLLSAMQAGTGHYLPATLHNTSAQVGWDGKTAQASGQVSLPVESSAATQVWVAAVAYDKNGTVVGVRRWQGGGLQPGGSLSFDFSVASVGGDIETVEFSVQASP